MEGLTPGRGRRRRPSNNPEVHEDSEDAAEYHLVKEQNLEMFTHCFVYEEFLRSAEEPSFDSGAGGIEKHFFRCPVSDTEGS
ncbi:MAG: hypothetical protein MMC23_005480 [Stictis urceolatum]|nr:hypothetical protein [Stictis urceolata]